MAQSHQSEDSPTPESAKVIPSETSLPDPRVPAFARGIVQGEAVADLLRSVECSSLTALAKETQKTALSGLIVDSALLTPSNTLKELMEDAAMGSGIVRTALEVATPKILPDQTVVRMTRPAIESAIIRASEPFSAFGESARAHFASGLVIRATDALKALGSTASTFDYPKATDAISALSSSVITTSALRDSLTAGMRATDFVTAHLNASNALSGSLAQLEPVARLGVAHSGIVLAQSALSGLSAITSPGRQFAGESALIATTESCFAEANILSAGQRLTAPFLGAVASVVSLESRLNELAGGAITRTATNLISGSALSPFRENLSVLSGVATDAWKTYAGVVAVPQTTGVLDWLRRPATELYVAAQVVAAVSLVEAEEVERDDAIEAEIDEVDGGFEARLRKLDPDLIPVYRGGVEALERGATDWQRHTMVSFRELATHVLHKLSPDEEVEKIATAADIVNGKPTRTVRLRYIYGEVANGLVTAFFTADAKATIALFDLLNNGTHRLGESATPKQIRFIKSRLVCVIDSMLAARGF